MNPLHDAIEVARSAHEGLLYGDLPYMAHLEWVVGVLRWFGKEDRLVVAGYLHDVLEDTPVSQPFLQTHFGDEVVSLVWAVTGQGPTRKDRNRDAYRKIRQLHSERPDLDPTSLKLGDRIASAVDGKETSSAIEAMRRELERIGGRMAGLGASKGESTETNSQAPQGDIELF